MIIENRHKKPYSEKLFNELCILYLLADSSNALDSYVLDRRFGISKRTLYRYIEEINAACPPLNLHFEGKSKHKYLCADLPEEYDDYELHSYISKNLSKAETNDERLCRCMQLLAHNYYCLEPEEYADEDNYNGTVLINGEVFAFSGFDSCDELYEKTSLRTQQRDIYLIKQVLIKMKEMEIRF